MPGRPTLPARRVRLIGRDRELALVTDRIVRSEGRLVTLTGAGGVGKTVLATEVARRVLVVMPDGASMVSLAGTREPDAVAMTCCESLGLVEQERPPVLVLTEHLAPRQALLVLDNAEHLVPELAAIVDDLLDACPDLRVLVTSRVPLRVRGEEVVVVPPLTVPDAAGADLRPAGSVELFVERAAAVSQGFRLEQWASSVTSICRRLDGIPLAVELAAAQVAALTPDEIDRHLIAGAAARNGQEGRPGAERLMDATLDWSHDLLDDEEQAVFRRLAVFADGWTLDAAEHVCADGPGAVAVAPVLVSLVESSLVLRVDRGGATRFRMLHPVREYAARRLEASGEEHATALRHATYYLSLVGPREEDWRVFTPEHLDLIAVEHANCLAALRFAEQTRLAQVVLGLDTSCSSSGGSADSCGPACGVSRRPCG